MDATGNIHRRSDGAARLAPARAPRILVVDDEPDIAELVAETLGSEGFEAVACFGGEEALALLEGGGFDLMILDVMMPGMDGYELCRRVRARFDLPMIFLSAKIEEADKVVGLMLGGDDYVEKPFKKRELAARVKVLLRRADPARAHAGGRVIEARGIAVDADAHAASLHGVPLTLTPKEFGVLRMLVERAGAAVSSQELYEGVWHEPFTDAAANSVMVHIRNLRKKLSAVDSSESPIETAWGVGYRIGLRDGAGLRDGMGKRSGL